MVLMDTPMLFLSIIFINETQKIYFHGAKAGHKVDALKASDKVCFTVYGDEHIDESEPWAPYVQSAVVFGRCRLLEAGPESIARLKEFAMKYYPDEILADEQIARNGRATQIFEITIEHMSGKQVQENKYKRNNRLALRLCEGLLLYTHTYKCNIM